MPRNAAVLLAEFGPRLEALVRAFRALAQPFPSLFTFLAFRRLTSDAELQRLLPGATRGERDQAWGRACAASVDAVFGRRVRRGASVSVGGNVPFLTVTALFP